MQDADSRRMRNSFEEFLSPERQGLRSSYASVVWAHLQQGARSGYSRVLHFSCPMAGVRGERRWKEDCCNLLGSALSTVRAHCNYLGVGRTRDPYFGILGASLVVKGTCLRSRWVPRAPNCPQAPKPVPSALELR